MFCNRFNFGVGCGGVERTNLNSFYFEGGCGDVERSDF